MNRLFAARIMGVPWTALALVALAIALIYLVIDTAGPSTGWQWLVLRWFHSLCWALLAIAAVLQARITALPASWAGIAGAMGGVAYLVFIFTSMSGKA